VLEIIWSYEIQIVPVLIAIAIFETQVVIQRMTYFYYTPIYFPVLPLFNIDKDVFKNLVNNYVANRLSGMSTRVARKKLARFSLASALMTALIIPAITGFSSAFFLTPKTLFQFLLVLGIYKSINITRSIWRFHREIASTTQNIISLLILYVFYLGIVAQVIQFSFNWTLPYVVSRDWSLLFADLNTLLFWKIGVQVVIFAVAQTFFGTTTSETEFDRMDNLRDEYDGFDD